jgi:hypothetical protein
VNLMSLQEDFRHWLTREPAALPASFGEDQRIGLAVYLNNYRSQLLACLTSSYPAVRALLGDAAFESAAATHIDARPPRSWTLDAYADGFPDLLARSFPEAPHASELARLELALAHTFVAADVEPIDPARLADVDWDTAVIHLTPAFALLPVTSNVDAFWSAISAGEPPPAVERWMQPAWLAVWREGFQPRFRAASAVECEIVAQVREGLPFGAICAQLVGRLGEEGGTAAAAAVLGRWLSDRVIARLATPD